MYIMQYDLFGEPKGYEKEAWSLHFDDSNGVKYLLLNFTQVLYWSGYKFI